MTAISIATSRLYKFKLLTITILLIIPFLSIYEQTSLAQTQDATLSLSPPSSTVSVGSTFTVNIIIDTGGNATAGVDIHYLCFDPILLEVQDVDLQTGGVQIDPGTIYPATMSNAADNTAGKIDFSQITTGGSSFTGSGILATITFLAKFSGTASINFDFTPGSTTDTNIASIGTDILASATGGSYTLTTNDATLSLSPPSSTVSVGSTFTVNIIIDTGGNATDGVDCFLYFDPILLEAQDVDSQTGGIQIDPGTLYPGTMSNAADNTAGKIHFSQITTGGSSFTGSGILATITFLAKFSGTASINFDFTPGSTTDTNVASAGSDILSSATGGSYTLNVPPNANAGTDITINLGEVVYLDGSLSNDSDYGPGPIGYSWRFVSLAIGSQLTNENIYDADTMYPYYSPDVSGTYVLELMVSDGYGSDYDNVTVEVITETSVPGDLDDDGDVDYTDFQVFRSTLGKCAGNAGFIPEADYDEDGCITYADYRLWYGYYRNQ